MKVAGLLLYCAIHTYVNYIIFTEIQDCSNYVLEINKCDYNTFYNQYKIKMNILLWLLYIIPFYYEIFMICTIIIQ
jgi:hypothetical protein